ncbi:PREDICTED: methyltransferase-like protein 22 [Amphimedon queenslandica]|uniref:Methyltransferase-like protein 22 n=1 Tax=Amphimedon queenslandica TaxID=400682 RepID=A0A1X7VTR7_AMPQE|nr:PREDICTED: methyltransferase-like protein 22 [Amphimedon queenslandica]|eukprot:XP_019853597.1 PREDICTED: methyltransferase-like protein 22 [Amphimedon queenslandica]
MEDNLVLSSVHIGANSRAHIGQSTVTSEFHYYLPQSTCSDLTDLVLVSDEDGDLDVPRRSTEHKVITLSHTMATPLNNVGTQLWSASLLMADYILSYKEMFHDAIVVELGSGCGFIGTVAASCVSHFFCTDTGTSVLRLCHQNLVQNNVTNNVSVHELDWFNCEKDLQDSSSSLCSSGMEEGDRYKWNHSELELLRKTSIILASDVIYDNELTDAFISTLVYLSTVIMESTPLIIISMEKRINFTLSDLAPSSPCYEYFCSSLAQSYEASNEMKITFDVTPLSTDFPQLFKYERVKELEIWKIKVKKT